MLYSVPFLLIMSITDTSSSKNCDCFLYKLVESSNEYKLALKNSFVLKSKNKVKGFLYSSPEKVFRNNSDYYSKYYNFNFYIDLCEDETIILGDYSFDPLNNRLYLSKMGEVDPLTGDIEMKFIKQVNYKKSGKGNF